MNKAEEYLKEKGFNPSEPIYWFSDNKIIPLDKLMEDYHQQRLKELTKGLNDSTKKLFISSNKDYASGYVFGVEKSIQLINSCKSK